MALLLRTLPLIALLTLMGFSITADAVEHADDPDAPSYASRSGSVSEDGALLEYRELDGSDTIYVLAAGRSYTIDVQQRTDEGELGVVSVDPHERTQVLREQNVIECSYGEHVIRVSGTNGSGTISISLQARELADVSG
ncbi:MAG: hypothetical protein ACLFSU_02205 [Acholeplasmataceae bacterium]